MQPPIVVCISELHRRTSAVVERVRASDSPVFVTQYASVAAVLLPRAMYDRLLRAAQASLPPGSEHGSPVSPCEGMAPSPLESPLAVFGPLPPGTRFLTRRGLSVDAALAEFLMEDGEEVRPILDRWHDADEEDV
jgi:prevent-host-death family protein